MRIKGSSVVQHLALQLSCTSTLEDGKLRCLQAMHRSGPNLLAQLRFWSELQLQFECVGRAMQDLVPSAPSIQCEVDILPLNWQPFWWQCSGPIRMCSTMPLISCNATRWERREGGGERYMYVEKESGTVGSTVGQRGGGCRAQNDRWLPKVLQIT